MKRGKNSGCGFWEVDILAIYVAPGRSCHSMPIMMSERKSVSGEYRRKFGETPVAPIQKRRSGLKFARGAFVNGGLELRNPKARVLLNTHNDFENACRQRHAPTLGAM
jgi:hypothetical protein